MDVWQLIERDHDNIAQLIHDMPHALAGQGVVRSRERLLGDLLDQLEAHSEAIGASLYAPLSRNPGTRHLVEELQDEHHVFMRQLAGLARNRHKDADGWLDAFGDATFLVDQHLHRHTHELTPAARELLGPEEVRNATRMFVRAKMRALQSRRRGPLGVLMSRELTLTATICAAVAGLGFIAWRRGWVSGLGRSRSKTRSHAEVSGQARGALAEPSSLRRPAAESNSPQRVGESVYSAMFRRVAGQNDGDPAQSDDRVDTAASDVLYRANQPSAVLRELVLPALREANQAWFGHGLQVYLEDQTLTKARDGLSDHPRILFRVTRATLPKDLVDKKAYLFLFSTSDTDGEVRFSIRAPGSAEEAGSTSQKTDLENRGELTPERLQDILERALRLALLDPL